MDSKTNFSRRRFGIFLASLGALYGCDGGKGSGGGLKTVSNPTPTRTCVYPLQVLVRDSGTQQPIAGATIEVKSFSTGPTIVTITTDASGNASTNAVRGTVTTSSCLSTRTVYATVSAAGYQQKSFNWTLSLSSTKSFTVDLDKA